MNGNKYFPILESEINCYKHSSILVECLINELVSQIYKAVANKGSCHMVIPGGSSSSIILEKLRDKEIPWHSLHIYPSDERCVPIGDLNRNDRIMDEILLNKVLVPSRNVHRIPAELGPEAGATLFSKLLQTTPPFDIVLVGMGTDGHIASLFPNHPALLDNRDAVPVMDAPKLPPSRVSIGLNRLKSGYSRHVVAIGYEKMNLLKNGDMIKVLPLGRIKATIWCGCDDRVN